jgi:hypothetical protein
MSGFIHSSLILSVHLGAIDSCCLIMIGFMAYGFVMVSAFDIATFEPTAFVAVT